MVNLSSADGRVISIEVDERLDLSLHSTIVQACELAATPGLRAIEVNVGKTRYIQDSGLAMLLMLRQCAGRLKNRIRVVNCSPEMKAQLMARSMHMQFRLR